MIERDSKFIPGVCNRSNLLKNYDHASPLTEGLNYEFNYFELFLCIVIFVLCVIIF